MKETGVVRRLDELGRVVIPKEIRRRLKINNGDMIDIFTENDHIVLKKYHPLNTDLLPFKSLILSVQKEYKGDYIIFDNSKIIYSTYNDINIGSIVSEYFIRRIDNYIDREISDKLSIEIVEGIPITKDMIIQKIFIDYELYGYVCVIDDMIGKRQREALSLIIGYFNHFLQMEDK